MEYTELMQQLKKKQVPRVCLLYGTEPYFIQNLKKGFYKQVVTDPENFITYDLQEVPVQEVIADAQTYPFFGGEKLIFASNPVFLKSKPDKLSFEHKLDALQEYIDSPADYSTIVFIANEEKLDQRKKIFKHLKKSAAVVACNQVKTYEIDKWIKTIAQQMNIIIDPAAMPILEGELSTNLQLMESEMNKLALYAGKDGVITKEIAESLVSHSVTNTSLRMVDAVMDHDLYSAIKIVKDLEKTKEEPIAMIGLLAFQFRMILRVKLLKDKGYGQNQIQKTIGAHPFVVKMAWNREKQFSLAKLHEIMDKLANADSVMKQGKMDKNIAFELLLHDLIAAA